MAGQYALARFPADPNPLRDALRSLFFDLGTTRTVGMPSIVNFNAHQVLAPLLGEVARVCATNSSVVTVDLPDTPKGIN
jgi:hypothetical protein